MVSTALMADSRQIFHSHVGQQNTQLSIPLIDHESARKMFPVDLLTPILNLLQLIRECR